MSKEIRLDIATGQYREDRIWSLETHRKIWDGLPSVGNCVSGELICTVDVPSANIPRNAKVIPYLRNAGASTWKKKSEFFVFSRSEDQSTGLVTLICYDAIFKAEDSFTQPGNQGTWPKTDKQVMQIIAQRTGASINADTLTMMNKGYQIPYPGIVMEDSTLKPDGKNALTMREVAGRIAAMYAGNWIINNDGEWQLVVLGDIPVDQNLLITEDGYNIVIGGVRILVR